MAHEIYNARAVLETDDALLVEADEFIEEDWIPKTCIDDESEVSEVGDVGTLVVSDWFAKNRGLVWKE